MSDAAIPLLLEAAEQGITDGQSNLGLNYLKQKGGNDACIYRSITRLFEEGVLACAAGEPCEAGGSDISVSVQLQ